MNPSTSKKQKRLHFGDVTVVHIPVTRDTQSSSLVSSQAISSELLESVERAFPTLGTHNRNIWPAQQAKENKVVSLLGDDLEGTNRNAPATSARNVSQESQQAQKAIRVQQTKLALHSPLAVASVAVAARTVETQLGDSVAREVNTTESGKLYEASHTLDSEGNGASTQSETLVERTSTPVNNTEAIRPPTSTPPAATARPSPPHVADPSPTFSQLVSAVDDILGCSQQHLLPQEVIADKPECPTSLEQLPQSTAQLTVGNPKSNSSDKTQVLQAPVNEEYDLSPPEPLEHSHQKPGEEQEVLSTAPAGVSTTPARFVESPLISTVVLLRSNEERTNSACVFCACSLEAQQHPHRAPPVVTSSGYFFHIVCALWCPEVYVEASSHKLCGVGEAVRRARHIKCALCRQPGATVGCADPACQLSFHLPCAVKARAVLEKQHFLLHCPAHSGEFNEERKLHSKAANEDARMACVKRARHN